MVGNPNKPPTSCPKCSGDRERLPSGWMRCAPCDTERAKGYHSRNRERHKERVKNYYQEHKELYKINALKNFEIIKQRNRDRYKENREKIREYVRNYRRENKELVKATRKKWEKNNPDKILAFYETRKANRHELYPTWMNIVQRCYNPNNRQFADWGERGVGLFERWWIFDNFVEDLPPRPSPQHSLDRYPDMFGDYAPGNVRWATALQQNRNRKNTLYVDFDGEIIPLSEAAERQGISYSSAASKYKGKTSKRMLTTLSGRHISIEQLSLETGIDERVLLRRARTTTNVEYLTSNFRATETHAYKGWQYTLFEIALMEEIDFRELLKKVVKEKIPLVRAVKDCKV